MARKPRDMSYDDRISTYDDRSSSYIPMHVTVYTYHIYDFIYHRIYVFGTLPPGHPLPPPTASLPATPLGTPPGRLVGWFRTWRGWHTPPRHPPSRKHDAPVLRESAHRSPARGDQEHGEPPDFFRPQQRSGHGDAHRTLAPLRHASQFE